MAEITGRESIRKKKKEKEAEKNIERDIHFWDIYLYVCMYVCRVSQKDIKRYGGMACASHGACNKNCPKMIKNRACQP